MTCRLQGNNYSWVCCHFTRSLSTRTSKWWGFLLIWQCLALAGSTVKWRNHKCKISLKIRWQFSLDWASPVVFWMLFWELAQAPRGISSAEIALGLATSTLWVRSLLVFGWWWRGRAEDSWSGRLGLPSSLITIGSHISSYLFLLNTQKLQCRKVHWEITLYAYPRGIWAWGLARPAREWLLGQYRWELAGWEGYLETWELAPWCCRNGFLIIANCRVDALWIWSDRVKRFPVVQHFTDT